MLPRRGRNNFKNDGRIVEKHSDVQQRQQSRAEQHCGAVAAHPATFSPQHIRGDAVNAGRASGVTDALNQQTKIIAAL